MKIETLLHDEIKSELEELKKIELGSEKYKVTVDGLTKLVDKAIEMDKLNIEVQEKVESRENDNDLKLKQMEEERKDRFVRNGIAVAGIVIPTMVTIWGTIKTIEFEKEGTITTIMGRGFINKLLPKK
jgi:hypothetical protein|nr:MAG TPA: hypothetical protein [Caudoviricetes sp.]